MRLFALDGSEALGTATARALKKRLDPHEERDFEDGEHKARPLVSVRGEDVYVLHSLAGDGVSSANDRLCKLLFFLATCRENDAKRFTAVVPYLAYGRTWPHIKALEAARRFVCTVQMPFDVYVEKWLVEVARRVLCISR